MDSLVAQRRDLDSITNWVAHQNSNAADDAT